MKLAIAGALSLALSANVSPATTPPNSTYFSDGTPPARFQGEAAQVVLYVNDVTPYCGQSSNPRYRIIACTYFKDGAPITILPNPCGFDNQDYAHLACHEKGHVLGWPASHGD